MQQAHGITSVLLLAIFTTILPSKANAKSSDKPIEVKSDPYGVGNPTKYSIFRGNTKVTFSHPLSGQFTRAEITTREKNGTGLTRFLLSKDRKTYRPILSFITPFETHYSKKDDKLCIAEPTPLSTMSAIGSKAVDGEIIAKKRDELVKSNFFDTSCFDSSVPVEHRNAIMNAAADVLSTKTQDVTPEPKYLRCLEKFGYAHESGTIQALEKVSKTNPKDICKLRLACTTDDDAEQGVFEEKKCLITLKTSPMPERDSYARLFFHELSHSVPMRDGVPLELLEECCSAGKKCEVLKAFADKNRIGEKTTTVAESLSQKNSVLTSTATLLTGTDGEAAVFSPTTSIVSSAQKVSLAVPHPTGTCTALGKDGCATELLATYTRLYKREDACFASNSAARLFPSYVLGYIILQARAEDVAPKPECEGVLGSLTNRETVGSSMATTQQVASKQILENLPQTSPITWEIPKESSIPIHMASTLPSDDTPVAGQGSSVGHTPTRTIASIEPLPDEAPARTLGSATNRRDVSAGRATVLVDTVERAARKVTATLTPEKVELLQVDRKEIFDADYKPKTKSPQYFVTSSATKPIQVADIGDIQGLSFPNPFAGSLPKEGAEQKLAKNDSGKPKSAKSVAASNGNATIAEKDATDDGGTALTAAALRGSRATTNAGAFGADSREPSGTASNTHNFKSMDRASLVKFLTSGFRNVSTELENPALAQALVDNRIQIHDHENRQIGSMKPETTFIYSSELGRLVQTRVNREKK